MSWPALALPADAAPADVPAYAACQVSDERLVEVSGLAVDGSRMFMVNDGGTSLQVFVLDAACRVSAVLQAPTDPFDVEDLARAADGTLWLADIGDNTGVRETVALHALREDGTAALYRLTYPDGAHDAEALLLDLGGQPYLVTKDLLGRSGVYTPTGPLSVQRPTPMHRVAEVDLHPTGSPGGPVGALGQLLVTGAAVSPDGRLAVLRTYTDAYLYAVPDGDLLAALAGAPERITLPVAPQGEAIAFSANGRDLLLAGEGLPFDVTVVPAVIDPPTATDPPAATGAPAGARTDDEAGLPSGSAASRELGPLALVAGAGGVVVLAVAGVGLLRARRQRSTPPA